MQRSEEVFRNFCRVKGTRCNAIMTMIERGRSNKQIADRFRCSENTINVYRKAYNNELSEGSSHGMNLLGIKYVTLDKKGKVIRDYNAGMSITEVAKKWAIQANLVSSILRQAKDQGKKVRGLAKKDMPARTPQDEILLALFDEGLSYTQLAARTGLTKDQCRYAVLKWRPFGRPGRKKK